MLIARLNYYYLILLMIFFTIIFSNMKKLWFGENFIRITFGNWAKMIILFFLGVMFFDIVVIGRMPCVINGSYSNHIGIVEKSKRTDVCNMPEFGGSDQYEVSLRENGKIKKYGSVQSMDKIEPGMEVEIHVYKAGLLGSVLARIDGRPAEYYQKALRETLTEKICVLILISIHALVLICMSIKRYMKVKKASKWFLCALLCAILYMIFPWMSFKLPYLSVRLGRLMEIMIVIYFIAESRRTWLSYIEECRDEWDEIWDDEREEKESDNDIEKKESSFISLTKMSDEMCRKYCNYRYHENMKNEMKGVMIIEIMIICKFVLNTILYGGTLRNVTICTGGVIVIMIWMLVYFWEKNKFDKIRRTTKCEYGISHMGISSEKVNVICEDGIKRSLNAKYDERIRKHEKAIIVYIRDVQEVYVEKNNVIKFAFDERS